MTGSARRAFLDVPDLARWPAPNDFLYLDSLRLYVYYVLGLNTYGGNRKEKKMEKREGREKRRR